MAELTEDAPVGVCVVGAGWMGRFHARALAFRVPGLVLRSIVDPRLAETQRFAADLGNVDVLQDAEGALSRPGIDAVVIASPPHLHPALIERAAELGLPVFCEKPGALEPAPLIAALEVADRAGIPVQFGFNRRFDADFADAKRLVDGGATGTPHLLRSLTRDPAPLDPDTIKPNAIFIETLVHDFDALRWFNGGAPAVEVYAIADALIRPDRKASGLLDTAMVTLRFANGAMGVAEASLQTAYGYDVRAEIYGPDGMVQAGGPPTGARRFDAAGAVRRTWQRNIELFDRAYLDELVAFRDVVRRRRGGANASDALGDLPSGADAVAALVIAHAAIRSVEEGAPVRIDDAP